MPFTAYLFFLRRLRIRHVPYQQRNLVADVSVTVTCQLAPKIALPLESSLGSRPDHGIRPAPSRRLRVRRLGRAKYIIQTSLHHSTSFVHNNTSVHDVRMNDIRPGVAVASSVPFGIEPPPIASISEYYS